MHPRPFHGEAAADVPAGPEDCFALLAAVDRYPDWCPDAVRDVQVLDRGAGERPSRVRMSVRAAWGPIDREFQIFLVIDDEPPRSVTLTRVTDHPTNQTFTATWAVWSADGTRITLELDAQLRVPSYVRANGVADEIARAFVAAASEALAALST